ncbi:MAG TPA: DUF3854 domain-containing protein, partial [Allocoleopsis sp.]
MTIATLPSQLLEASESTSRLNSKHYKDLIEKRKLSIDWILVNCRSITTQEATEALGYSAQSPGILLQGNGWQQQFRPDKPWISDQEREKAKAQGKRVKAPKYRTPQGDDYDAMLPTHPSDKTYWSDLEALKQRCWTIDDHPYILITEGFFKAIAGCTHGLPTIALLGVEMGLTSAKADPQGKRYLVPTLERLAKAGFGFIIGFDADCATNPNVLWAERKLTHQLKKFGVPVLSITGLWDAGIKGETKGMDDFIKDRGIEEFRQLLNQAYERSWDDGDETNKTGKLPPADRIAAKIAEEYQDQLVYNNEIESWMRYSADAPGMWSAETNDCMEHIVSTILDGKGIRDYGSHSYITNIIKKLKCKLFERKWVEPSAKELLPFRNGVLEVATGKLLPHNPGYRLTWQLPRNHNPLATDWNGIDAFLDHLSGGNAEIKSLLLCFCNAVLKGRSDLQRFMHLIGLGGSGKGTFARLLTDLIGVENTHSSTLEDWCSNRFEPANAYGKRFVIFWDEDKQTGKIGKFLSLTGGDWIRAEEKGRKAFQYRYDGMVAICSNLPIFTGDAASRVKRRAITVPCNQTVPIGIRRDLNAEFQAELDAFTNYVLSIPDTQVERTLKGLKDIPECTLESWENLMRVDSIAAWLNDRVIYDAQAETQIGNNREEGANGEPIVTLYGSYCQHARQSGKQIKSHNNFSADLLELCRSVLGWEVDRKITKTGRLIRGLRLRTDGDGGIPTHEYCLIERVIAGDGLGDGLGDGSEPLQNELSSQGDGLIQISLENRGEEKLFEIYSEPQEEGLLEPSPEEEFRSAVNSEPSPKPSLKPSPGLITDPDDDLLPGTQVRYEGDNRCYKKLGYNKMTLIVEGVGEKHPVSKPFDKITCLLPDGGKK